MPPTIPTIDHFIGQTQVVNRFKVALEAAWNDGTRLPHMLFVGPPGVGKTNLAQLAAKEMGTSLVERIGQVLSYPAVLNGVLLELGDKAVFLLTRFTSFHPTAKQRFTGLWTINAYSCVLRTTSASSCPQRNFASLGPQRTNSFSCHRCGIVSK